MKTLGPFLVQSNAADTPLFWYQFSLGGYQDQSLWSILRMPFREDAGLPVLQAFKTYDPEPCVLHAFDPAYGSYFSLVVTTEHKILRFRPTGLTHPQKVLFNTEQYTGQGFTPTRTDFDITQYHYQVTAEALGANENKLKLICQSQYQATQPPPPWGEADQSIPAPHHFPKDLQSLWSINGFFSAWQHLKSEAQTPTIYCHALISMIAQHEKASIANTVCAAHHLTDEAQTLKRYLTDTSIYKSSTPLNQALFDTIRDTLFSELNQYCSTLNHPPELTLTTDNLLSFQQATDEHLHHQAFSAQDSERLATRFFIVLTSHDPLSPCLETLRELEAGIQMLLANNVQYADAYMRLSHQFYAHFPDDSLEIKLQARLAAIQLKQIAVLNSLTTALISLNQSSAELLPKILPLLSTAKDASIVFCKLESFEQKNELIDALDLANKQSPFLQTIEDLSHLAVGLKNKNIKYLFKKRTPNDWGSLVQSIDGLKQLCTLFAAPEKKKIIALYAADYASLLNSTEALLYVLNHLSTVDLKQILPLIPVSMTRHWMQTPQHLQAFLSISTQSHTHHTNASAILNAIPSPYRITALVQSETPEEKIKPLLQGKISTIWLYLDTLSSDEWALLFKAPKPFIKAIMREKSIGRSHVQTQATALLNKLAELLYTHLISKNPQAEAFPTTPITNFEPFKRLIISIFPSSSQHHSFFPTEATVFPNTTALNQAKTIHMLKTALIEIYCLTDNLNTDIAVMKACHAIKAHEIAISEDHTQDLKRARVALN